MTSSDDPPAAEGVTAEVNSYNIRIRYNCRNVSGAPDITRSRYIPEKSLQSIKTTTRIAKTHQWSTTAKGPSGIPLCISRHNIYPTPIRPKRIGQMTMEGLMLEVELFAMLQSVRFLYIFVSKDDFIHHILP